MISEGSHGAPDEPTDPGYPWLWLIPTVVLVALVIGLWYGSTF